MATFDKTKPAGSDELRNSDEMIRDNWAALESALGGEHVFSTSGDQTGQHNKPTFPDQGSTPSQPTATNEVVLYNNGGLLYFLNEAGTKRVLGSIPSGTKMLFKQGSAPAGWTFQSEDNDRALINTSTEADGGATGGSWTIGLSVNDHTLLIGEMPEHGHTYRVSSDSDTDPDAPGGFTTDYESDYTTGPYDSGNATSNDGEQIGSRGDGQAHGHGMSGDDGTWRPNYVKCITCSKD